MLTTGREKIMARRRYQKGSLFLRGKRVKTWIGRWLEDEIDGDGHRTRVHRSVVLGTLDQFPTRKLAQRELDRHTAAVNDPAYHPVQNITFAEFAEKWQNTILPNHKPSSQCSERAHLTSLKARFGLLSLTDISCIRIQEFVASVDVAPKTIRNLVGTLRTMWKTAKAWGYVHHDPFTDLSFPRMNTKPQVFYTIEQAREIIARADEPFKTMFWIVAETGIRGGELCGLGVDDIDLEHLTITVWRSAWRGTLQTPKTDNAIRCFSISPELAAHVKNYLDSTWRDNPDRLLFSTKTRRPYNNADVVELALQPIAAELGLPKAGLHALRHGNATVLDRMGVPLRVRQARLGHAQFATTFRYTHLVSEDDRRVAAEIGRNLCPSLPQVSVTD
jgi:integrase